MNREIIFRGKRLDNGEWVLGFYFRHEDGRVEIWQPGEFILAGRNLGGLWYFVDPSTVGQYTGMTDRKGTKIFEGDIVTINGGEEPLVAAFINFSWRLVSDKKEYRHYSHLMDAEDIYTVIGNIHENPERKLKKSKAKQRRLERNCHEGEGE